MPKPRFNFMWFWVVVAVGIVAYAMLGGSEKLPVKGNQAMVDELVKGGCVDRILVVDHEKVNVFLHKECVDSLISSDERFKDMPRSGAQITYISHGDAEYFERGLKRAQREARREQAAVATVDSVYVADVEVVAEPQMDDTLSDIVIE